MASSSPGASDGLAGPPAPNRAILRRRLDVVDAGRELEGGDLLLGLDERTVGDQHVSLAEADGGRIYHAGETVTEESVCPSICFVGTLV